MNENNELNDIILNKDGNAGSNKKIILAVATLGVILIIVVMLMNSLSSNGTDNLPQAVLPPEPQSQSYEQAQDEPLFEEIEVVEEESSDADLDLIAQRLKQESLEEKEAVVEEIIVVEPKKVVAKKITPKKVQAKTSTAISYYIQVGSFSKYEPNKKFLKNLNKVLVGPFKTPKEARNAKRVLRAKVEPGAFLVKL